MGLQRGTGEKGGRVSQELDDAGQLLDDLNAARNPRQSVESKVNDLLRIVGAHHRELRRVRLAAPPPSPSEENGGEVSGEEVRRLFTDNFDGSLMRDTECKAAKAGIRVGLAAGHSADAIAGLRRVDAREVATHVGSVRHALRLLGERHPDTRPVEAAEDALRWLETACRGAPSPDATRERLGAVYEQLRQARLEGRLPADGGKSMIDELGAALDLMRAT